MKKLLLVQRTSLVSNKVYFSRSVFSRLREPFDYMHNLGIVSYIVVPENDVQLEDIEEVDVIVFSKHVSAVSVEIAKKAKELSKKIIYDLDDFIVRFPKYSGSVITDEKRENLLFHFANSDCVTVATKKLFDIITKEVNLGNFVFVPNGFNIKRHTENAKPRPAKTKIVFTNADALKVESFKEGFFSAVNTILREFPEIELDVFADPNSDVSHFVRYNHMGSIDWFEHKKLLAENGYSIGLVPLGGDEDDDAWLFNSCKSPIKFLEYGGVGIAGIYSDVPIYQRVVRDGETGILCKNTADDWERALRELVVNNKFRESIIWAAQEDVKVNHSIEVCAKAWEQVLLN